MFFLLISCIVSGQEQLCVVKVSPLSLLSPNYPALHVGLEFKSSCHWSFSADYGFKTPDILFKWNYSKIHIRQYKYRAEVRYYLGQYFNRTYLASEFHFIPKSYIRTDNWYSNSAGNFAFTSANVKTKDFGAVLKMGYNRDIKLGYNKDVVKNLLLDIFIGLGPRWLQVKYSPTDANLVPFPGGLDEWIVPNDQSEGTFLKLYFITGLRLGYIISRKWLDTPFKLTIQKVNAWCRTLKSFILPFVLRMCGRLWPKVRALNNLPCGQFFHKASSKMSYSFSAYCFLEILYHGRQNSLLTLPSLLIKWKCSSP